MGVPVSGLGSLRRGRDFSARRPSCLGFQLIDRKREYTEGVVSATCFGIEPGAMNQPDPPRALGLFQNQNCHPLGR